MTKDTNDHLVDAMGYLTANPRRRGDPLQRQWSVFRDEDDKVRLRSMLEEAEQHALEEQKESMYQPPKSHSLEFSVEFTDDQFPDFAVFATRYGHERTLVGTATISHKVGDVVSELVRHALEHHQELRKQEQLEAHRAQLRQDADHATPDDTTT